MSNFAEKRVRKNVFMTPEIDQKIDALHWELKKTRNEVRELALEEGIRVLEVKLLAERVDELSRTAPQSSDPK